MILPKDFRDIPESTGAPERPDPDAYICRVIDVHDAVSKNGRNMLVFDFDIDYGPFKNFYARNNDQRVANNLEPNWLRMWQVTDGKALGMFKNMLKNFERSNDGWLYKSFIKNNAFNERSLIGKRIGLLVVGEEYLYNNKLRMSLKVNRTYSVQEVIDSRVPDSWITGINGEQRPVGMTAPNNRSPQANSSARSFSDYRKQTSRPGEDLEHVDDIDIPFV